MPMQYQSQTATAGGAVGGRIFTGQNGEWPCLPHEPKHQSLYGLP